MSTILTAAGESLIARLQAEGKALIIDTMILANVPGQDHTQAIAPGVTVPAEDQIALRYAIPPQYRAYVMPVPGPTEPPRAAGLDAGQRRRPPLGPRRRGRPDRAGGGGGRGGERRRKDVATSLDRVFVRRW